MVSKTEEGLPILEQRMGIFSLPPTHREWKYLFPRVVKMVKRKDSKYVAFSQRTIRSRMKEISLPQSKNSDLDPMIKKYLLAPSIITYFSLNCLVSLPQTSKSTITSLTRDIQMREESYLSSLMKKAEDQNPVLFDEITSLLQGWILTPDERYLALSTAASSYELLRRQSESHQLQAVFNQ